MKEPNTTLNPDQAICSNKSLDIDKDAVYLCAVVRLWPLDAPIFFQICAQTFE